MKRKFYENTNYGRNSDGLSIPIADRKEIESIHRDMEYLIDYDQSYHDDLFEEDCSPLGSIFMNYYFLKPCLAGAKTAEESYEEGTEYTEELYRRMVTGKIIEDDSKTSYWMTSAADTAMMISLSEAYMEEFGDDFDPYSISEKSYKDIAQEVFLHTKEEVDLQSLDYFSEQPDERINDFIEDLYAITYTALASGDSNVRKKSIGYLKELSAQNLQDNQDIAGASIQLGKLLTAAQSDPEKLADLKEYQEFLGEDFEKAFRFMANDFFIGSCRRILEQPKLKSHGKQIAALVCERLKAGRDSVQLMERYSELVMTDDSEKIASEELGLPHMELDFEILPPGELKTIAKDIIDRIQTSGRKAEYDPERIQILYKIMEAWGKDKCYSASGRFTKRNTIKIEGKEYPDEYVILVLQDLDEQGNVIGEHAIAESPIVGPHALYVCRHDVSPGTWREVFSLSKRDAREVGARRIKHRKFDGQDVIETVSERACTLLCASEEEFHTLQFHGDNIYFKKIGNQAVAVA